MQAKDLEIFNLMPFLFWVKDEEGRYVWGTKVICDLANENVVGKTGYEFIWADDADGLRTADQEVWKTGKPDFVHEFVTKSTHGQSTLNVCKFVGDFEGNRHVFGISFVADEGT